MCLRRSKTAILSAATSFPAVIFAFLELRQKLITTRTALCKNEKPNSFWIHSHKENYTQAMRILFVKQELETSIAKEKTVSHSPELQSQEPKASGPFSSSEVLTKHLPTSAHVLPCIRDRRECSCPQMPRPPIKGFLAVFILTPLTCVSLYCPALPGEWWTREETRALPHSGLTWVSIPSRETPCLQT